VTAELTAPAVELNGFVDPWRSDALRTLLDLAPPDPAAGLPLLWHLVHLLEHPAPADIGADGHPSAGIPAPPEPGRRRMWAGGRVTTLGPLYAGREAARRTTLRASVEKIGRTGPLTFVTVAHEIVQDGRTVAEEEQDILYRPADSRFDPASGAPNPAAGLAAARARLDPDPVLLFRFSALTYNGHRIHYDRDYARDVEGYPGLLVHGPLQALMMAETGRRASGHDGPARFSYRLVAPLFDGTGFEAVAVAAEDGYATTVRDDTGRVTARGRFTPTG